METQRNLEDRQELEIFRAQIEKEFEYPSSKVSPKIISIIKKLLNKYQETDMYFLEILIKINGFL